MRIFQSEEVIKLRNVLVSLEITNGHRIRRMCMARAGIISEIHAKTACGRTEDCLVM